MTVGEIPRPLNSEAILKLEIPMSAPLRSMRVHQRQKALLLFAACSIFGTAASLPLMAQEVPAKDQTATAKEDNAGLSLLDEATDAKLDARTPDALTKVIEKAEAAIRKGLDEDNTKLAKEMISGSAYQRAKGTYEQFMRSKVRSPNGMRLLRNSMLSDVKKAIDNAPDFVDAYLLLAQIEEAPKAIEAATKAIELTSDDAERRAKAFALRSALQKDNKDKLDDLKKAKEADPSNTEIWQAIIVMHLAQGEFETSLSESKLLLEQDPGNMLALQAAVQSLVSLERNEEAVKFLEGKIETTEDADVAPLYATLAKLMMELPDGEFRTADALKYLDKAIEADPRNIENLMRRCQLHLQNEQVEEAEKDVEDILSIQPNNPGAIYFRSLVAVQQKRVSDAIEDMKKVIAMAPDNIEFLLQLGSYYQLDDRPKKAIQIANEIIDSGNDGWKEFIHKALRMRGDANLAIGEHRAAMADFEKAIKLLDDVSSDQSKRDKSGLLNNLAWLLSTSPNDEIRDGARAVKLGTEACELTEYKEAHILSTLASAYAEIGNFEEAVKWSTKAVEAGKLEKTDSLEQLEKELENYQQKKPWREKQETQEKKAPIAPSSDGVDT